MTERTPDKVLTRFNADAMVIANGRVIDPATGRDEVADLYLRDGKYTSSAPHGATMIDASGLIVCPGLHDIHVHLREPGGEQTETIASGTAAAAHGGFTFVACMPNTKPTLDNVDTLRLVLDRAKQSDYCAVGPVASITRGRRGTELTDFSELLEAGAVAFSDDGTGVEDDAVMLAAFEQASRTNALLIQHCEYKEISAGGVMHKGETSRRLGLPGLDPRSEEAMIERDIDLCRRTGGRYHVAHISTAKAIQLVRRAKAEGLPVTAEVCAHHLALTDEACATLDPNTKMHPPLRPMDDVIACRDGLRDGTIDCIVTDHAPHTSREKAAGFLKAPPGIVGLESALGLAFDVMAGQNQADWIDVIRWFTLGAGRVFRRPATRIDDSSFAELTFIEPDVTWAFEPEEMLSLSRNTPFGGWNMPCRAIGTLRGRALIRTELLFNRCTS